MTCDGAYKGRFLDPATLWSLSAFPEYELDPAFLTAALAKGDECYGFLTGGELTGGELAAYGWYSRGNTAVDIPDVELAFDQRFVYMYKGFTLKKHRGQRLHAVGMTRALDAYLARGFAGVVSYVEWSNFDSLKSCYRMGYRSFGNIYVTRLFGRVFRALDADAASIRFD